MKSPAAVRMLLSSHAWASRDREIVLDRDGNVTLRNLGRLRPYVGTPSAEWLSARLSAYRGLGRNRTIQLYGPSGCGKTTLARSLGQIMCGTSARTLRVTGGAAARLNQRDLIDLVDLLGPDVFIIDDWAPRDARGLRGHGSMVGSDTAPHLSFLEDLHARVPLTILTTMALADEHDRGEAQALGLRPGRVDEVLDIKYPDDTARRALIESFCAEEELTLTAKQVDHIVKGTNWFSGANLQELIGRIAVFGADSFEEETKRMGVQVEVASPAAARARRYRRSLRNPIQKGKIKPNAKVRDLKWWAGRNGLSKSGTRADLVARIETYLQIKAEEAAARRAIKGDRPAVSEKTKGES